MVHQIFEMEAKLASVSFSTLGSIYYRSDLESKGVAYERLDSAIRQMDASTLVGVCRILPFDRPQIPNCGRVREEQCILIEVPVRIPWMIIKH